MIKQIQTVTTQKKTKNETVQQAELFALQSIGNAFAEKAQSTSVTTREMLMTCLVK